MISPVSLDFDNGKSFSYTQRDCSRPRQQASYRGLPRLTRGCGRLNSARSLRNRTPCEADLLSSAQNIPLLLAALLWHGLKHIPMLDHLPVFVQPEDVDARPIGSARPHLMAVQHDVVPLCNDPHEPHLLAWVLPCHPVEVVNEGVLAVCHHRVVLRIAVPTYRSTASAGRHWLNIRS